MYALFRTTVFLASLLLFCGGAGTALAATLDLNPPQGTYVGGTIVPMDVLVDTEGKSVNAISARLVYPADLLEAVSIGRDQSVIDLWLREPSVDRASAAVVFEGLILNPGFTGVGKVITVNFRVRGTGDARITFSEGLVLANDGFGTNVLRDATDARLALLSGPAGVAEELPETIPREVVDDELLAPVVISYTENPEQLGDFTVRGVTYPNTRVNIYLQSEKSEDVITNAVVSDAGGNFAYVHESATSYEALLLGNVFSILSALSFEEETYHFWLTAIRDNVETAPTQSFAFVVGGLFGMPAVLIWSLTVLVLLLIAIVWLWVIHRSHRRMTKRLPPHIVLPPTPPSPGEQGALREVRRDIADLEYDVEKYDAYARQQNDQNSGGG